MALYRPKYRKGDRIKTVGEAANEISAGRCLYIGGKVQNSGWLQNITIWTLKAYIIGRHGVFYAIPVEALKEIEFHG